MPYDDPDTTDPLTLHGVAMEVEDDSALRTMAECFVEEYARMGFSAERLLRIFRTPGYAGPNLAYRALGESYIARLVDEHIAARGSRAAEIDTVVEDNSAGRLRLRVLEP